MSAVSFVFFFFWNLVIWHSIFVWSLCFQAEISIFFHQNVSFCVHFNIVIEIFIYLRGDSFQTTCIPKSLCIPYRKIYNNKKYMCTMCVLLQRKSSENEKKRLEIPLSRFSFCDMQTLCCFGLSKLKLKCASKCNYWALSMLAHVLVCVDREIRYKL